MHDDSGHQGDATHTLKWSPLPEIQRLTQHCILCQKDAVPHLVIQRPGLPGAK